MTVDTMATVTVKYFIPLYAPNHSLELARLYPVSERGDYFTDHMGFPYELLPDDLTLDL